jgi:hypothetical protein
MEKKLKIRLYSHEISLFSSLLFSSLLLVSCGPEEENPEEDLISNLILLTALRSSGGSSSSGVSSVRITGLAPSTFFNGSTITITGSNLLGKGIAIYRGSLTNTLPTTVVSETNSEIKLRINGDFPNTNSTGTVGLVENGLRIEYSGNINFLTTISLSVNNNVAEENVTSVTVTNSANLSGVTWSVSPTLPSGLTLNTNTGAISGTPTAATGNSSINYTLTATISDSNIGGSVSRAFSLAVVTNAQRTARTCNTTGTAAGCISSIPFTCSNATVCFSTLSGCRNSASCGF